MLEAGRIPLEKGVEHDFGVAMSMKLMAEGFELVANFDVVIDFAVEDDDVSRSSEWMG